MIRLEWVFLMQFCMGILMIIFLQKLTQMKKQVDEITQEVKDYVSYITKDMQEELDESQQGENEIPKSVQTEKKEQDEAQNRLIQAVLGEYFQ